MIAWSTHDREQLCRAQERDEVQVAQPFRQFGPLVGLPGLRGAAVLDIRRVEAGEGAHHLLDTLVFEAGSVLDVELGRLEQW